MSVATFSREKQLAFGSLIGSMFATIQREHGLTLPELAQLALTIAAARAVEAKWDHETFTYRALDTFDALQAQLGKVTVDGPPLLINPPGKPL